MEIESVTWFSSFFTFFTAPMPSTCPCTMWPERNDFGVAGSSRFTRFPFLRAPKFVRSKVSDMTSAKKELPVFLVTVKHAPLMLMLSPFLVLPIMSRPARTASVFRVLSVTVPVCVIIPLNIQQKIPSFLRGQKQYHYYTGTVSFFHPD